MHARVLRHWFLGLLSPPVVASCCRRSPTSQPRLTPSRPPPAPQLPKRRAPKITSTTSRSSRNTTFSTAFWAERDDVEPSILWRPKGTPVPFGAMLLNSAVLYWLLIRFAKKPIADALKARKVSILRGMEEAGKMKKDSRSA